MIVLPWILIALYGTIFSVFGMISHPDMIQHLWFLPICLTLCICLGTSILSWQIFGKYLITVNKHAVIIDFKYNLFRRQKIIPTNKFIKVSQISSDKQTLLIEKFWFAKGGNLEIRYLGGNIRIGLGHNSKSITKFEQTINSWFNEK